MEGYILKKYVCGVCGFVYDEAAGDPDNGIAPGTIWEDLPDDWECPLCGATKAEFEAESANDQEASVGEPAVEVYEKLRELSFGVLRSAAYVEFPVRSLSSTNLHL